MTFFESEPSRELLAWLNLAPASAEIATAISLAALQLERIETTDPKWDSH
jgi:hypothetical protein